MERRALRNGTLAELRHTAACSLLSALFPGPTAAPSLGSCGICVDESYKIAQKVWMYIVVQTIVVLIIVEMISLYGEESYRVLQRNASSMIHYYNKQGRLEK